MELLHRLLGRHEHRHVPLQLGQETHLKSLVVAFTLVPICFISVWVMLSIKSPIITSLTIAKNSSPPCSFTVSSRDFIVTYNALFVAINPTFVMKNFSSSRYLEMSTITKYGSSSQNRRDDQGKSPWYRQALLGTSGSRGSTRNAPGSLGLNLARRSCCATTNI